jgi:Icc-related predicted phosphoesterase
MIDRVRCLVAAAGLLAWAGSIGCDDKQQATPSPSQPAAVAKPAPPPPPPLPIPEPRPAIECAAPIDPGPITELKIGKHTAMRSGARLTFSTKDADSLVLGVLGPINEDSGSNQVAIRKYLKFFADEKVDAILVTGDVGEVAEGITRVLSQLGRSGLPVFVVIGNRECRAEFTDGVAAARAVTPNIVSLNEVRVVEFPELTLVSVPGYHDPSYINCKTGCQYLKSTVDEAQKVAIAAKTPVALIAHGPPRGSGPQSLDFAGNGGNVGDVALAKLIGDAKISFGFFSNIKEAGGRASKNADASELLKEGEDSPTLYLNPGPADTMGWDMNDGSKSVGMAAVFRLKGGVGHYKLLRLKPMTAAEKLEAKKLDPAHETPK